ncbi:MAG: serine hydrolase, partial [Chitinophagia bacterium]
MKKSLFYCSLLLLVISNKLTAQWSAPFNTILSGIQDSVTKKVLASPKTYRYQLVYTKIDRDQNGIPHFTNYTLHADPENYFNPASMVKMPLAFLAMEKLYELNLPGVNKYTTMQFDSNYQRQVAMYADSSAENKKPSIAHFIKRAFLISENDPYNRLYQFVGQGPTNQKLIAKGYTSTKITRQFMGYTEDQNRHTNGIQFMDEKGLPILKLAPKYNKDSFQFGAPILIGEAHWNSKDQVVNAPFDFTRHNNISLEDMQKM